MRCWWVPRSASERLAALLFAVALAAASAGADETLLDESQAAAVVVPGAEHFERSEVPSTVELRSRVAARLGEVKPTVWEPVYKVATGFAGGERVGRAIIVEEIGKHRPITLAVGIDANRKVTGVAVLVYREAYGGEIRSRRFLQQYRGKTGTDPLLPSRDIQNITGATLSARAVGRAVKKAIAVLDEVPPSGPMSRRSADEFSRATTVGPRRVREAHYVMGTLLELTIDAPSEESGRAWIRRAVAEARRLDAELTSFDPESPLSRLNGSAGGGAQRVPPDLYAVVALSRELAADTGGTFDVSISPLVRVWRRAAREGRWPPTAELAAAKRVVGPDALRLIGPDEIALPAGAELDLGGVGKGYAVDRIAAMLRGLGATSALVNFGESSLAAIGPPPGEPAWSVWMRRGPSLDGPLLLRNMALSTSATFGQSERVGKRRIGHIIDPRSGLPLMRSAQATVLAPSGAEAEAWSKALLVDPSAALRALAARPQVAAVVLGPSARRETENFVARTSWRASGR